jgi:4-hydroxy-3-polyprenylbenzoate decarboxylase
MPSYKNLEDCLKDLEKNNQLIRIKEEVDANLEMAAIHLRVFESKGPALLFENIKGTSFRAASNIFGTIDRSKFIFRDTFKQIQDLIELKNDPIKFFKKPFANLKTGWNALHALPLKNPLINESTFHEIKISDLPLIKHWKLDGGAFVTLPQVYTEDVDQPGIMKANLGMYRIQLDGNNYTLNEEIGLHYQLHRGIGIHQKKANRVGKPLKVSIFVGGPPSHTVAAVMPLPEGMSEMTFAGVLGGRRFRYKYIDGYCISLDADFVITGQVFPNENKPEGPFGDHLGYYSLQHPFPLLKVHKVFAKKNAIWPFTVVGRPPQEDTSFGDLIHALTGNAVKNEIPGLKEINAVDAAGVHPLLLAIGSERYTPYSPTKQPAELLTIANHVLGTGQLSLAKFLFITADETNQISTKRIEEYLIYIFERIRLDRDIHFYTKTTIDTLDYSGESLNSGSKVVLAAYGNPIRKLITSIPDKLNDIIPNLNAQLILPGVVAIEINSFTTYENAIIELTELKSNLQKIIPKNGLSDTLNEEIVLFVICDDANYISQHINNFLWITFTRCNPSHDIHGVHEEFINKHWNCFGSLILDARIKKHHAPILEKDPIVEEKIEKLFQKGGSLFGI